MATIIGRDGVIKSGGTTIAQLRSYSIEESADTVESTVMTDTSRGFKVTLTSFSGSADVYWDPDDAGQDLLTIGAQDLAIVFYPEGDGAATGDVSYSGNMHVTGITRSGSFDGMVEASITFQGNGALTENVVA
jgi:predicted secreted protein